MPKNRRSKIAAAWLGLLVAPLSLSACQQLSESNVPVVSKASDVTSSLIDLPVSGVQRDKGIAAATEAIKIQVNRLDVEAVNHTVKKISDLIEEFNARLYAMQDRITSEIEQAQLAELSRAVREASAQASAKLNQLDAAGLNQAVSHLRQLAVELSDKLAQLDIEAANRLLKESSELRPRVEETLTELTALTWELRGAIQDLPLAELSQTVAKTDAAITAIGRAFSVLRLLLIIVVVAVLILCPLLLIRRLRRTGP
ncbi:MAG: hypothetical protein V3W34_10675 [Phycisphaerae bacterium]